VNQEAVLAYLNGVRAGRDTHCPAAVLSCLGAQSLVCGGSVDSHTGTRAEATRNRVGPHRCLAIDPGHMSRVWLRVLSGPLHARSEWQCLTRACAWCPAPPRRRTLASFAFNVLPRVMDGYPISENELTDSRSSNFKETASYSAGSAAFGAALTLWTSGLSVANQTPMQMAAFAHLPVISLRWRRLLPCGLGLGRGATSRYRESETGLRLGAPETIASVLRERIIKDAEG